MTREGFIHTADPEEAAVIVINTCAFIEPAVEESIEAILDSRHDNEHAALVVAGCLPLRYRDSLRKPLPEVDLFVVPDDIAELPRLVRTRLALRRSKSATRPSKVTIPPTCTRPRHGSSGREFDSTARVLTTPGYAYLKIAEGCSRKCHFCTIPSIRGPLRSVKIDELERETRALAAGGVRELVLVAQDLTRYGVDRTGRRELVHLLERLSSIHGIEWIRLMYLHPDGIPSGLSQMINGSPKILPYLDIPFQHVSATVLRSMGRPWKGDRVRKLVNRLRKEIHGLVIRTTLMVGYPTEGEREFDELKRFVESSDIERIGVFVYSPEEGTIAAGLGDPVPRSVKQRRAQEIIAAHSRLLERLNRGKVGSLQRCLVEGVSEETDLLLKARCWDQAPEVDGALYITAGNAIAGEIHTARITGFHGPDLFGEIIDAELLPKTGLTSTH
jgi:ribosomal protein S12 methylthiotransferase